MRVTRLVRPENEDDQRLWRIFWREALRATTLGWDMAIPIFGGVLVGYLLDRVLGTDYIFTLGLLMMGIFVSYYNIARFIQKLKEVDDEMEQSGITWNKDADDEDRI